MKSANKKVLLKVIPLDDLIKEFIKENNFSQPKSITDTSRGKLIFWNDSSQVILYSKVNNNEWTSHPYLGSSVKVFSKTVKYCLEGVLEGNGIKLEAEVSNTNYSYMNELRKIGLCRDREDDLDYWFVINPRKARSSDYIS